MGQEHRASRGGSPEAAAAHSGVGDAGAEVCRGRVIFPGGEQSPGSQQGPRPHPWTLRACPLTPT